MIYSASDFRTMAREALRGKWGKAIIVTVLAALLGAMTATATMVEFKFEAETGFMAEAFGKTIPLVSVNDFSMVLAVIGLILPTVQLIIGGAMTLGYYQFHQNLIRKERAEVDTLFVHREKLWHGFCLNFWMVLYTFLWTLCFIIPGIMAAYSYSMAHFIANDHPEMTAREALTASKEMMKGHRWRLFCLEFSFLGWDLLAGLTLGIGSFVLAPYKETANAFFYQDLLNSRSQAAESYWEENREQNTYY